MTQNVDNDFLDAGNAKGNRSKDPTPERSYLAWVGWLILAKPGTAGWFGCVEHGEGSWELNHQSDLHKY